MKPFESRDQLDRMWPFLDRLARRAWERDSIATSQKQAVGSAAGQLLVKMRGACNDLPPSNSRVCGEPPRGIDVDKSNWSQFACDELVDMIGREDVCSVTDAYLKTTSLLRALHGTPSTGHQRFLFRGQRDITWRLLPRKGRALCDAGWTPPDPYLTERRLTQALPEEIQCLEDFRNRWDTLESVEDEDRQKVLPPHHPGWWFRMQHYDPGDGTRLLDVTTSLIAALFFACVQWSSGTVNDTVDGVIYLWPEGQNANVDDLLIHQMPETADGLFSQHPDAPRFILNPPHNERSKAQSGAFFWWPRFWDDPPSGAPYFLRVAAHAKRDIVRDLLSMGFGPKEAVRGAKGLENETLLRADLDLPGWRPVHAGE